ncbi:SDR family NAD(P)-dependent oxidoreductase [Aromatoleum evansii]|uniref:SDR family NAD(P)-dependent oxidoreductase n=1 Tax=Aromatoleum evansii TaxID=59406 RepID=A0ABZ1AM13_AROEV|nr:SDR family NAD(P)-dependent oxidoreductase [Aromatoleum evansii]
MKIDEMRGAWALVTGASSGIGREYCVQLACRGINLVLVARRASRLEELAQELMLVYKIGTLVIAQDLGVPEGAGLVRERVRDAGISIRLLVNNAAFGQWGRFEEASPERYQVMLQTNVASLVGLTQGFLSDLERGAPSAVVNLASAAAYQPVPYMAVYAASKAFVMSFSLALYAEWLARGVLVQTLVPGATESEFDQVAGAYASAITSRGTPRAVVRDSLLALERGSPVALNARGIFKQRFFAGLFPPKFVVAEVAKMFRPPTERS